MSKRQLSERQKLERDLKEQIRIRSLPIGSPEWDAAIKSWVTRRVQLSPREVKRRNDRWLALGSPELTSPEWQAELVLLKAKERKRKPRVPPLNTDPNDPNSLYRQLMLLTAHQAAGRPVDFVKLPGQSHYRQTKQEQAAARRLYRWLWRTFPGALEACDDELRELIRRSGGVA